MRKLLSVLIAILPILLWAANMENIATQVIEPDGRILNLLASGDEYFNRLHDANGYTIIQSPVDGFYYYASTVEGEPVASAYRVGSIDPQSANITPNIRISEAAYRAKVDWMNRFHATKADHRAPNTGTVNNINVFIRFSDQSEFEDTRGFFDARFNPIGEEDYSLRNYFRKVSYDQLDYVTHHYPQCAMDVNLSYQDPQPRAYYMPYNAVTNPTGYSDSYERAYREHNLLADAIDFISTQVPASLNIDADNDGLVDNVCFIIRGPHTAWADLLWAHRWVLYYEDAFINGKQVWDYTFQPENLNDTRVLCHEMFHSVGAPDLYHYTFNGITPAGCWDIMESGYGHMGIWMKSKYGGWIDNIPILNSLGYYSLNPISSSENNAYKIPVAGSNSEFFILEYRKQDADIFEQNLPDSGLLIYRIKSTLDGNADGPPDEVYIYRPNGSSSVNGLVFEATFSAENYRSAFNDYTNPNCFLQNGSLAGINISEVGSCGETITFFYDPQDTVLPPRVDIISPANAAVLPREIIELRANCTHPSSSIASVSFEVDGLNVAVVDSSPFVANWDASSVEPGFHQLLVTAISNTGESYTAQSTFRIVIPSEENWFGWTTPNPVYEAFGRGVIPIRIAVDMDLGETEYLVRKLAFHLEENPWGVPETPGLVNAKINRFQNGAVTEQTILDIGDIYDPMQGRYEHVVDSETLISGKIAVVLNLYEYKYMMFDHNGVCGHSWITETGRPWTDAIGRGVVGAAIIELLLQAPSTDNEDLLLVPSKISLSNHPNPFNPSTTISFSNPKSQKLKLNVYNLKGQKVKTLRDVVVEAGQHSLQWDGLDENNQKVSSGIYFLRLSSEGRSLATRKLILCK